MLRTERIDNIELLVLDRPNAGNSIGTGLTTALLERLTLLKTDSQLHAVIITGAGDKFFCTGGDIKEYQTIKDKESLNAHFDRTRLIMDTLEGLECPVISAINGYALGGGAELLLCTDYRISVKTAEIGWPQARLGIIPAWNGIDRLVRDCGPRVASKLMLSGKRIDAKEAKRLGIIDEVIEKENIVDAAFSYARTLKDSAPLALRATKKIIKACSAKPPQEVRKLQYNIFPDLWFSDDHKEAEKAFMEKRKPIFTGK